MTLSAWIRPEGSAELAQETSRREARSSRAAPREVYHQYTEKGPFSESEREIALQRSSLERSERAFDDFSRKIQKIYCNIQAHPDNESSSRTGAKMVEVNEQENLVFGSCDTSVELATMYRKYFAVNYNEERDRREGAGLVKASTRFDKPKWES